MAGRLTQAARELRKRQALVSPRVVWVPVEDWAITADVKAKCRVGINWLNDSEGRPHCYAKDQSGLVVGIIAGGVSTAPPKADAEVAAKRLLAEAVAERARLTQQSITKIRANLVADGIDPDELIRQAREREAAEANRAAKRDELARRLEDVK